MRGAVTAPVVSALVLASPPSPTIVLGAGAGASDAGDGYCGVRGPVENRVGPSTRRSETTCSTAALSNSRGRNTRFCSSTPAMWASGTSSRRHRRSQMLVIGSEEQLVDAGRRRATSRRALSRSSRSGPPDGSLSTCQHRQRRGLTALDIELDGIDAGDPVLPDEVVDRHDLDDSRETRRHLSRRTFPKVFSPLYSASATRRTPRPELAPTAAGTGVTFDPGSGRGFE